MAITRHESSCKTPSYTVHGALEGLPRLRRLAYPLCPALHTALLGRGGARRGGAELLQETGIHLCRGLRAKIFYSVTRRDGAKIR